jgi:hypothetical protein
MSETTYGQQGTLIVTSGRALTKWRIATFVLAGALAFMLYSDWNEENKLEAAEEAVLNMNAELLAYRLTYGPLQEDKQIILEESGSWFSSLFASEEEPSWVERSTETFQGWISKEPPTKYGRFKTWCGDKWESFKSVFTGEK